jgi:hypothetical protein
MNFYIYVVKPFYILNIFLFAIIMTLNVKATCALADFQRGIVLERSFAELVELCHVSAVREGLRTNGLDYNKRQFLKFRILLLPESSVCYFQDDKN